MKTLSFLSLATLICISLNSYSQVEYKPKNKDVQKQEQAMEVKKMKKEPVLDNIIKVNMLSPFFSTLMISYERRYTEEKSFQVGIGYMNFQGWANNSSSFSSSYSKQNFIENTVGYFITPEYRYILQGENLRGSYIAPFARYIYMQYKEKYDLNNYSYPPTPTVTISETYTYQTLGIGLLLGTQQIYKNTISIDIFAGPVYNILYAASGGSGINTVSTSGTPNVSYTFNPRLLKDYSLRGGLTIGFLF